jgi:hypothetical protein
MFEEKLCALSPLSSAPLTMSYMHSFKAHDLHIKKMIEAILLFKFFQPLDIVRAQILQFSAFWGKKNL